VCGVNLSSRDKIDDLLARGRLSGPRRERIFEEVDRRVRGGLRARSKFWIVAGPLALAAGLAILLRSQGDGRPEPYAAKGTSGSTLELACSGGELSSCPRGSKLMFRLQALPSSGFLHAYAEPLEGQERVWYYPTAANPPPYIEPGLAGQLMGQGIVIGQEHAPGRYRVHLVVASTPLSREELLAPSPRNLIAAEVFEMVIVEP
jgi:hypothetical protein